MTVEEYYAIVKRLGLTRTNVPTVFRSSSGDVHNVPDPNRYTSEQRSELIDRLKATMGIVKQDDAHGYENSGV